jgi:transposase InsO family protein
LDEKKYEQLGRRHGGGFVRHLMAGVRSGDTTVTAGALELGITERRFRQLYAEYLKACAEGSEDQWIPGVSGGNRRREVPAEVEELWRRMLGTKPPAPYGFAASEAYRQFNFNVDRATVRRWAQSHGLAHPKKKKGPRAPVRRWQCQDVGALWQMDASPHRWFGPSGEMFPMIELVDDCSRVITGAKLYPRECLLSYMDLLSQAFERYGFPLSLYVDYHSFFFSRLPDTVTQLGWALRFYDVSLRYAPTPQAKGKVERHHQFWQNRLPSFYMAESIHSIDTANEHLDRLREHHNQHEQHRELSMTPQAAWHQAKHDGRCVLRPFRRDPWWPYVWSQRVNLKVDIAGTVPVGTQRIKIPATPFTRVTRCEHIDGSYTFLARPPGEGGKPIVLMRHESSTPNRSSL